MDLISKEHAKRKIAFGLKYRGPYGKEQTDLDKLTFGAPILIYRHKSGKWEGPFKFISKENETVCAQLPHGRKIFSSHVVKSAKDSHADIVNTLTDILTDDVADDITPEVRDELFGHEYKEVSRSFTTISNDLDFTEARNMELNGLAKAKVFKIVKRSLIPKGSRIYGTRFIDAVKHGKGSNTLKSRLVAQNYRDKAAKCIPTRAPTISRLGLRVARHAPAMHPDGLAFTRDVTQAYTQNKSLLERAVYLEPPQGNECIRR